jgi:ketosteroid isomerase-like protein
MDCFAALAMTIALFERVGAQQPHWCSVYHRSPYFLALRTPAIGSQCTPKNRIRPITRGEKMAEQLQRQRVLNFLNAYYGGDTKAALKCCDDDVLCMVYLPVELFPYLGPRRGKPALAEVLALHEARFSERRFEVKRMVADADGVAVILDVAFTKRADGRVVQLTSGTFYTLRRGLITEMRTFMDTVDAIEQLTGRDLIGPLLREAGSALQRPPIHPSPRIARTK